MVQTALEENPFSGHVFVFRGRRGDLIKVLWFDGDELCLFLAYRSPLVCTNHGSMANALPQAIGAQVRHPARQVISLSGDGGIAMLLGDLLSLRQLQLPVKVIVFKNDAQAFVELEMKSASLVDFRTDLQNPNFAKLAEAAGLLGLRAETPEQVRPLITEALRHEGPALVEVLVNRQELSMPPTITLEQMKGLSLFMIRAVLSGRGDEIIDLAKTNLFR